jgi:hypothetical protein
MNYNDAPPKIKERISEAFCFHKLQDSLNMYFRSSNSRDPAYRNWMILHRDVDLSFGSLQEQLKSVEAETRLETLEEFGDRWIRDKLWQSEDRKQNKNKEKTNVE